MEAYSKKFRSQVLAAWDLNEGTQAVALRFGVSQSWVRRIIQQRRETGQIAAKTTRDRTPEWHAWADWLVAKIDARPDIYLRELQAELKAERGEEVCLQTICNACAALEQSRKKDADCQRTGSARRRRAACGVARFAGTDRSGQSRFHRRNVG
jgi:transposase